MTIFNYKIINYKKFVAFMALFAILISSVSFLIQKPSIADAAITDCTTTVGNLVQNCSFENPAGPLSLANHINANQDILDNGYAGITNWPTFDDGAKQGNVGTIFNSDPYYIPAQGDRLVDVSGHTSSPSFIEKAGMGIQQTITGLTIGKTYEIIFAQGYSPVLQPSKVTVLIDGTPSVEGVGGFNVNSTTSGTTNFGTVFAPIIPFTIKWKEQRTTFVATATTAIIGFRGEVTQSGRGDFIDNIIVKEVVDTISPTLTLSPENTTISGPFTATVCTSEPLATTPVAATLELSDFVVTNGTASGLSGPTTGPSCPGGEIYTVTITPTIVVDGVITVSVPSGAVTDPVGNSSTTTNSITATYDIITVIISPVHIETDNGTNNQYGTIGNTVTLSYTTDIDITTATTHTVTIAGQSVTPSCTGAGPSVCTATLPVTAGIPTADGSIMFSIVVDNQTTTGTTDGSSVTIDRSIHVEITTPGPSDDLSTFLVGGECEVGAGNVTISGTGFTPSPVTVSCVDQGTTYGWFEYEPLTGVPGTITVTATQTDLAGNVGTDTNIYTLTSPTVTPPTVTVDSPRGITPEGVATVSGSCSEVGQIVTIAGSGFDSAGTTICLPGGIYEYIIVINGNTSITASQTNSAGTVVATTTTRLPRNGSSGGCEPGAPCDTNNSNNSSGTQTNNSVNNTEQVNNENSTCPAFSQYLKKGMRDGQNGISEISKVQKFLNKKLGISLDSDGVFGSNTQKAVKQFQSMFFSEILSPWNLSGPTGWWYQSTRSYANFIENCSEGVVQLDNTVKIRDGNII